MVDILLTDSPDSRTFSPGELLPGFSIFGLRGDDILTGSSSNEVMFLGKGNDQAFLEGGDDEVNGNNEQDFIIGGAGNDTLRGGKDRDLVVGGPGDDLLLGDRGADGLIGNEGADTFGLFADDTGDGPDLLLDFDAAEGDRLALLGGLRPDEIVIQEIPTPNRDVFFAVFPPGLSLQEILQNTQIPQDLFNVAPPEVANFELLTPSGQAIAQVFLTTEADIRSSLIEF
ncbi:MULTISPECIES: calcium-binding protein [unclassified Okeania]|uniref:calcium-binding protein n=1 Tax=unclassified Okeania TaxID=2634635 RepID=UPI0013BC2D31|nr:MULTISPECIES: calcium-binding protein [unclassified Okeania]NET14453.1 calcium-binding protein [Okeania sp. SIO1H6]NES75569.1 calcium-binding protein [Okeania sp. SIO1H4]NET17998.1 calcium-binding protein [Okeania sp. SIO1H5]NET76143.1 calcium-binding protein [Okeania sp. SIO1F9]NET93000.1 calcium-binding protein [Okeania sp. SIO1H2]